MQIKAKSFFFFFLSTPFSFFTLSVDHLMCQIIISELIVTFAAIRNNTMGDISCVKISWIPYSGTTEN